MQSFWQFWRQAVSVQGSITPYVMPHVLGFGLLATLVCIAARLLEPRLGVGLGLPVAPYEIGGAILGVLLVMRTNSGYDRWWEARKLWGGITNQSRNLVITVLSYGPEQREWREQFVRWTCSFAHAASFTLRAEPVGATLTELVGPEANRRITAANHMPSYVALELGKLLKDACTNRGMDRFAFLQADQQRAALIDHMGACERILRTPLPLVFAIKIRRYIVLFLATLPFVLLHNLPADWFIPFITMLVAYPLVSLEQIGVELENPFAATNLSHLPLVTFAQAIEKTLLDLLYRVDSDDQV